MMPSGPPTPTAISKVRVVCPATTALTWPRDFGREHHLVCRPRWRELAGQHGGPVLAEVLAVEAAVQAVGEERMIDAAMDQRHTAEANVGGVGDHAGQR